jgi:hypothetical protein
MRHRISKILKEESFKNQVFNFRVDEEKFDSKYLEQIKSFLNQMDIKYIVYDEVSKMISIVMDVDKFKLVSEFLFNYGIESTIDIK